MGKQKEFKLVEIDTKERADGEHMNHKYAPVNEAEEKDITISVKGESMANDLGLPVDTIGDTIMIEFGATTKQEKLGK